MSIEVSVRIYYCYPKDNQKGRPDFFYLLQDLSDTSKQHTHYVDNLRFISNKNLLLLYAEEDLKRIHSLDECLKGTLQGRGINPHLPPGKPYIVKNQNKWTLVYWSKETNRFHDMNHGLELDLQIDSSKDIVPVLIPVSFVSEGRDLVAMTMMLPSFSPDKYREKSPLSPSGSNNFTSNQLIENLMTRMSLTQEQLEDKLFEILTKPTVPSNQLVNNLMAKTGLTETKLEEKLSELLTQPQLSAAPINPASSSPSPSPSPSKPEPSIDLFQFESMFDIFIRRLYNIGPNVPIPHQIVYKGETIRFLENPLRENLTINDFDLTQVERVPMLQGYFVSNRNAMAYRAVVVKKKNGEKILTKLKEIVTPDEATIYQANMGDLVVCREDEYQAKMAALRSGGK